MTQEGSQAKGDDPDELIEVSFHEDELEVLLGSLELSARMSMSGSVLVSSPTHDTSGRGSTTSDAPATVSATVIRPPNEHADGHVGPLQATSPPQVSIPLFFFKKLL